ncbi:hypothetical protein ACN2XU_02025 [Primorskyibacter sp. 2E107]|uniref:hypothetical protein n=1 Tax=Primorskyibacter sp. 2E107 TaxID=3403458 RepID=UPI003AF47F2E
MKRYIAALALTSVLAACSGGNPANDGEDGIGTGTQPLVDEPMPTTVPDEGGGTTGPDVYGGDIEDDLTMNDVQFDAATGELVLNNLPFDGNNSYARTAGASAAFQTAGSSFDAYRNTEGTNRYYAVFRQSDQAYAQVTAVGTDNYVTFGFGGAAAQRLSGDGALPDSNQSYIYDGEYAAVRTIIDPDTGSEIQYVIGTARVRVDIQDFDDIGAVEGFIANRTFFDNAGIPINDLNGSDERISLGTAQINFDNWTIESSTASVYGGNNTNGVGATGTWEGLFAGPNGEEVAGVVVVEGNGPIGIDPATGEYIEVQVREVGGFVGSR